MARIATVLTRRCPVSAAQVRGPKTRVCGPSRALPAEYVESTAGRRARVLLPRVATPKIWDRLLATVTKTGFQGSLRAGSDQR